MTGSWVSVQLQRDTVVPFDDSLDFDAAEAHLQRLSCSDRRGDPWPVLRTGPSNLGVYGVGVELYFRFTCRLAVVLCFVAAFALPAVILNCNGNVLAARDSSISSGLTVASLAKTTIANLGTWEGGGNSSDARQFVQVGEYRADIRDVTLVFGVLDALSVLVLLLAASCFELVSIPRTLARHQREHVTPEVFALAVHNLPKQLSSGNEPYAERLRRHFEALLTGCVTETSAVPGLTVVQKFDGGNTTALFRHRRCPRRAARGLDARGRRLGRIVDVDVAAGHCDVEWLAASGMPRQLARYRLDAGELLDASLLARLEQSGCSPWLHELGEPLVHQVSLVRSYASRCRRDSGRPQRQASIPMLDRVVQRVSKAAVQQSRASEELDVTGAFIVFNRARHRDFLHSEYRYSRRLLGRHLQGPRLKFAGRGIIVDAAPSPSNIYWENLGYPPCKKLLWRTLGSLACLLVLLGCVALFLAAKHASLEAWQNYSSTTCGRVADGVETPACTCQAAGYQSILADNPAGLRAHCQEWLNTKIAAGAWGGLAALSVVLINRLFEVVIVRLVGLQRPKTVTSQSRRVMYMVFLVQLMNLGLITALVHADLGVNVLGEGILGLVGNGTFEDVSFEWFLVVGSSVLLTLGLNAVSPLLDVMSAQLELCRRRRCISRINTQAELIGVYTPPHFAFAVRHAQQLSGLFATLLFSPGMPLLTIMAFVSTMLFYWCDKYVLLRASRIPPRYTEYLMVHFAQMLPVALWLHSVGAVWIYGQPEVVPSYCLSCGEGTEAAKGFVNALQLLGEEVGLVRTTARRSVMASALPNAVALGCTSLVLALRVLRWLLGTRIANGLRCLFGYGSEIVEREGILGEAFKDGPLQEMKELKVAHSYELPDVSSTDFLSMTQTLSSCESSLPPRSPASPTLLASKVPSFRKSDGNLAAGPPSPVTPTRSAATFTQAEASSYVVSLRLLTLPQDEPVQLFLEDVLMSAPVPEPWTMIRDRHGRPCFAHGTSRATSWQHPLEHVLEEMADVCRNCLICSEADRRAWVSDLKDEWTKDAHRELGKWRSVPQDNGLPYYCNLETRETSWQNPTMMVLPAYQVRLSGVAWLMNRDYFARLTQDHLPPPNIPTPSSLTPDAPPPPLTPSFLPFRPALSCD